MTADAGLASDSSETDFRLAAVLGSSSGTSCVYLCIVCIYLYTSGPAIRQQSDWMISWPIALIYTVNHRRVRLAG